MNSKRINNLVLVCGLVIGVMSVSSPQETLKDNNAEDSSTPSSKLPPSDKKTFSPKPPTIRVA